MQNLLDDLKKLLKKDKRLTDEDGELLKNKIVELALKMDTELLELVASSTKLKEHFFVSVGKMAVFDKEKFIKFVSNKDFLPDSYTAFKNKIGLTVDDEYISEKKDVVLSWPYKDCVLEGGQTKEDAKRDEVFWNETLAPDEVNRLLEPKVFTNWKLIDKKGEHPLTSPPARGGARGGGKGAGSFDWDKQNYIIKGNNLLALHSLKKRFAGQVKLIYIDPPYNTGGADDTFTYNNNFNNSTWLTFMKNRLEVARDFLSKDGFIAITIDHVELFYIGTLADDIFGRDNRVGIVTIYINPKGRQHEKFFSASTEYMLVYAKDPALAKFNRVALDGEKAETFNLNDEKGKHRIEPFIRARTGTLRKNKPVFWYPIYVSKDLSDIALQKKSGYHEIFPIQNGKEFTWKTISETFEERNKDGYFIAKKKDGEIRIYHKYYEQQVLKNIWLDKKYFPEFQGTNLLKKLLGGNLFSYPKSLYAVLDTLKIMTKDDDIVLDFFAGSGTTGHATLALNEEDGGNRRFILVEQLDKHIDVCVQRIQKVLSQSSTKDNFVYTELVKWNEDFSDQIQKSKTKPQLQKLWKEMQERAHLSYRFDDKEFKKSEKEFKGLSVTDQKKFLLEVLDKNQLYVNFSEIEDGEYGVREEDKKLNGEFYGD